MNLRQQRIRILRKERREYNVHQVVNGDFLEILQIPREITSITADIWSPSQRVISIIEQYSRIIVNLFYIFIAHK